MPRAPLRPDVCPQSFLHVSNSACACEHNSVGAQRCNHIRKVLACPCYHPNICYDCVYPKLAIPSRCDDRSRAPVSTVLLVCTLAQHKCRAKTARWFVISESTMPGSGACSMLRGVSLSRISEEGFVVSKMKKIYSYYYKYPIIAPHCTPSINVSLWLCLKVSGSSMMSPTKNHRKHTLIPRVCTQIAG